MKVDRPKNILITDSGGMAIKLLSHSSPPPSRNHSAIMCNCQSNIKFRSMSLILDCTSSSYNSIRVWKFRLSALGNDQHLDLQRFFFNYIAPWSFPIISQYARAQGRCCGVASDATGMIEGFFGFEEIFNSGIFLRIKIWQVYFWWFDLSRDCFVYSKQSIFGGDCVFWRLMNNIWKQNIQVKRPSSS